ncbi:MAG: response regulator [Clostridiales bacterium]|nr:response regulator [Clostridiales bacterium]
MAKTAIDKNNPKSKVNLTIPLALIFVLMVTMIFYTSHVIRRVAVSNINEVGDDRISNAAAEIENYLDTAKSVLWVTADTVDHMSQNGATSEELLRYITYESQEQAQQFDENYTGIYGYVGGEYLDGVGWVPYEGYDATQRDWYKLAVKAEGETIIVPPYVDAQTGAVIISICRSLSNGEDVLSLDMTMNYIQKLTTELEIKGKGYGFIFNRDGLIIAHQNESMKGHYLTGTKERTDFMKKAIETRDGSFEFVEGGDEKTAFVKEIMDQWYVVIIIGSDELYAEVWQQTTVNILICSIIYIFISLFYALGYRNERRYSKRIEEMRDEEQRQAYESKALKLEKEAADKANKAKSDFLAQMSHEIRTPINAVIGMDEMILRETNDPGIREYAQDIQSASKTLLSLVNGVLDFSRIESGKMEIVPVKYSPEEMINSLVNMISDRAEKKGLELILDIDPQIPSILYGDDVRIRQVITNLLTNAVKYTEKGSVTLSVKLLSVSASAVSAGADEAAPGIAGSGNSGSVIEGQDAPGTCKLHVEVKDTGIGIKDEDREKLFQSFQRLEERRNRNIEGTGLGMGIVVGILSLMDSSIHVESEYGIGSVFSFDIVQTVVDSKPMGEYRKKRYTDGSAKRFASITINNASILVVDDNEMNLKVAKGLMKKLNADPDTASGGKEAVEMIRKKHYDLILMDHMMPEMDGLETLKKLREESLIDSSTSIIALTANAIEGAKEMYINAGFNDYLAKPISPDELEQMMSLYLPEGSFSIGYSEKASAGAGTAVGAVSSAAWRKGSSDADGASGDEASSASAAPESTILRLLREKGLNVSSALVYSMNDEDLYRELLDSFVDTKAEKAASITKFHDEENWNDYKTFVHALKSSARTIGADRLSKMALDQENASRDGDVERIAMGYDMMMTEYSRVVSDISDVLDGIASTSSSIGDNGDDPDIMEFYPE